MIRFRDIKLIGAPPLLILVVRRHGTKEARTLFAPRVSSTTNAGYGRFPVITRFLLKLSRSPVDRQLPQ
jgi:hypothetical protein